MSEGMKPIERPGYLKRKLLKLVLGKRISPMLSDGLFLKLHFANIYGRFPDLKTPRLFDEKILWYNLNYRTSLMTRVADKYLVRGYLEEKGFGRLLNELYGVYDKVDDIDLSSLPERFVLKATHGSAMNIICRDKTRLDWGECRKKMDQWLRTNYYTHRREWAYRDMKPRIVCEKYLENEEFGELIDYKFYCYNDKPQVIFVCTGRYGPGGVRYKGYDMAWNSINVFKGRPCSELNVEKPANFGEMTEIARSLCAGFPFIRVDLYSLEGRLIFGELTFYPDAGLCPFAPYEYNYFFGDFFELPAGARA